MALHTDADGFTVGFELGKRSYCAVKHPPLSYSLAKAVLSCPEDAYRITQRAERIEREVTDAMDDGSILDALLTSQTAFPDIGCEMKLWTAPTKKATEPVEYCDWNGLRIIQTETLQTAAAKGAAADARANDLTPVLAHKFEREHRRAQDMLVRMELAGFDRSQYHYQASLLWTETARNGMRIQCRGRLDFLAKDWTSIVDLKRVEDLDHRALERAVDRYRWAMQAAAYSRAVMWLREEHETPEMVPTWRWLFARTSPVVACTLRAPEVELIEAGHSAWNRAVNEWAEGLETGMWRGHESDHTPLNPTAWAVTQMHEDEEANNDGSATAA
jgi:hypothetical protein